MGTGTQTALQNAVFYVVEKMFSLRGGAEMRQLKTSQIKTLIQKNVYTVVNSSETYKSCTLQTKVVPVFTCPLAGKRCPVHLLDLYFSNLPEEAFKQDTLFVRPLEMYLMILCTKPWYSTVSVGKNILETKLGAMCSLAGI